MNASGSLEGNEAIPQPAGSGTAGIGERIMCPISLQPMGDPVANNIGQVYDRPSIEGWMETAWDEKNGSYKDPLTGQKVDSKTLIPIYILRGTKRKRDGSPLRNRGGSSLPSLDVCLSKVRRDPCALYVLGKHYMDAKDIPKAQVYLHAAANLGHWEAMYLAGLSFVNGSFGEKDPLKAFQMFQEAAGNNHAAAARELAKCYLCGSGADKNEAEALYWYTKAANEDSKAQVWMGDYCFKKAAATKNKKGTKARKHRSEGVKWYTKASGQNDATGHESLAHCLVRGNGTRRNVKHALELYKKAYDGGNGLRRAAYFIGLCLLTSKSKKVRSKAVDEACRYFTCAAETGYVHAQMALAHLCLQHNRLCSNSQPAVYWVKLLAEKKNPSISYMQCVLSVCYLFGKGGAEVNVREGAAWMIKSAENGYAFAKMFAGLFTEKGFGGIKPDFRKAAEYYKCSPKIIFARFRLGLMYERGTPGVPRDVDEAKRLFLANDETIRQSKFCGKTAFELWFALRGRPYWKDLLESEWGRYTSSINAMLSSCSSTN